MIEYRCILVDDEDIALDRIEFILKQHFPAIKIAGRYNTAIDAIDHCLHYNPDIIFSDIKMPGMNGIDFFQEIVQLGCNSQLIITSAYSETEFLLKGIKLGLVDYLVKPYSHKELIEVVQKAIDNIAIQKRTNELEELVHQMKPKEKFPFKTMREIVYESPDNIVAIVAQKKICHLYTLHQPKVDVNYLLKELDSQFKYDFLVRVDKSHIINLSHVISIDVKNQVCVLDSSNDKIHLTLSESGIKELKRFLS